MSQQPSTDQPKKVQSYFVTGTGRCGTMLLAKLFSLSQQTECVHEQYFRHQSMISFYRDDDFSSYRTDIESALWPAIAEQVSRGKSLGVSSGHMYFSVSYLHKLLGASTRFILLVRRPENFVRSALARGFFDESHPRYCAIIEPHPSSSIFTRWNGATPFEKCLWYWNMVNRRTMEAFSQMPTTMYRIVRIEDLSLNICRGLCDFLQLYDIGDDDIRTILSRRINVTPSLEFEDAEVNTNSVPMTTKPYEEWTYKQKATLETYAGELRSELYP